MVSREYTRLSIVGDPERLLGSAVVRSRLLADYGLTVVSGSQIELRVHYEQTYKPSDGMRYVYVCPDTSTLLPDMRAEAYVGDISSARLFPLFADRNMLRGLSIDELAELEERMGTRRLSSAECGRIVGEIRQEAERERRVSVDTFRARLADIALDWQERATALRVSDVMADAALADVYGKLTDEWERINSSFQQWIDKSYFALQNSSPLLRPACVNGILPHIASKHSPTDKVALVVVDGLALWQWCILRRHLGENHLGAHEDITAAWLPTVTMLSRQAIFRGSRPQMDYHQSPAAEKSLWQDYWQQKGFSPYETQYIYEDEAPRPDEAVRRLAYVTVEMDEKMHALRTLHELALLTEAWARLFAVRLATLKKSGYALYLTADHGCTTATGQGGLTQADKVFLFKDGSRGKRHLIYAPEHAPARSSAFEKASERMHDDWIASRDFSAFEQPGTSLITHGGCSFAEVVVPFITLEQKD